MKINGYPLDDVRRLTADQPDAKDHFLEFARMCANPSVRFGDDRDLIETRYLLKTMPKELGISGNFLVHVAIENLATARLMGW